MYKYGGKNKESSVTISNAEHWFLHGAKNKDTLTKQLTTFKLDKVTSVSTQAEKKTKEENVAASIVLSGSNTVTTPNGDHSNYQAPPTTLTVK